MPKEDKDDILTENINTAVFLFVGIVSMIVGGAIIVFSAYMALFGQQLPADFTYRLIVAPVFLLVGLGFFQLFRKRRESRKEKTSALFT